MSERSLIPRGISARANQFMGDQDPTHDSRRAIDFHIADKFARMDEKLNDVRDKTDAVYDEVFGGPGGKVGIAEKVRNIMLLWGVALFLLNYGPKVWDYFFAKKSLFGTELTEKWKKGSTKRVRIYNRATGNYEYYYMLNETKQADNDE